MESGMDERELGRAARRSLECGPETLIVDPAGLMLTLAVSLLVKADPKVDYRQLKKMGVKRETRKAIRDFQRRGRWGV